MAYVTFYKFPSTISVLCDDASLLRVQLCARLQKRHRVVAVGQVFCSHLASFTSKSFELGSWKSPPENFDLRRYLESSIGLS